MRVEPLGDRAILIACGMEVSPAVHLEVRRVADCIRNADIPGVTDVVPAFASVAVHYDPAAVRTRGHGTRYASLAHDLELALSASHAPHQHAGQLVEIPVCYGGRFGPDLDALAAAHDMTADDVVRLHTAPEYLVYMLGFLPGFPYLGGLHPRLATPRRAEPRTHVPAGSVGIGGEQTGVYPLESPGGWHLIGRTPLRLFRPEADPPTLLAMGDRVRFRSVTEETFRQLESRAS